MDLITTNKSIICILGDYKDKLKSQLSNFEGGMQQFIIMLELDYKKKSHQGGGIFKLSWLHKLKTFPSVVIWIYDISEPEKLDKLLDNYNILKQTISLAKSFQPKIIIVLTGKNVGGFDFNYLKKEIDLRKVFAVEFENIGQQLKRIKKMIVDDSGTFYQELFNKYKSEASKLQKSELSDQKLIIEIKKTLISEIENNAKKANKHMQTSYEIVTQLAIKRKDYLNFTDDNSFYTSYELIQQAEEYREIADQLRFKLFRNLDIQDVIQHFEVHFRTFKNLIFHKLFEIQEYLWRVKIFVAIIKFIESKLMVTNYTIVYNYFQATLLSYIKLMQLNESFQDLQIQQFGFLISKQEPEYLGRPNYQIREKENEQPIDIKSDQKLFYFKHIINYRRNEINLAPNVQFIFDYWKQYNDNGQNQNNYANVYFKYLQIIITQNFELKSQIADQLIYYGLIDEYKNILQLEAQSSQLTKQIQIYSDILIYEQDKIQEIKKLAQQLNEQLDIVIPANTFISISKLESDEQSIQLKIDMNITQQILDMVETGVIISKNNQIEFIATNHTIVKTDKIIEKPVKVQLFGKYLDKLQIKIIAKDVELYSNKYKVGLLSTYKRDPPIITFKQDFAYINELNQIEVELSYQTELELLNFNQSNNSLLKFKENNNNTINSRLFTLQITDSIIHDRIIGFKIQGEEYFKKIKFIFPFTYFIKIKQLSSVFQNAQNRNRNTLSVFSKCAVQLEVQNIDLIETEFIPTVDLDFYNKNKLNVIFMTRDQATYTNFGQYRIKYSRNQMNYEAIVEVTNVNVISYLQNVEIISPPTSNAQQTFEIVIKLKTREPQNYFIQLKDQDKKQFFIMGKIKQMKFIEDEASFSYLLFPIEFGKCNLPGILIEIRQPNNPNQLVFDSSGMKSILILP
ncbi:unnamed protein product [Paramecium pentaurelia]|uniref:Uncharacterized protein n=1 Tax=Paramecium pentaurelia TaxID=43138 RepID=A0A8S1SSR4_9CILI|nr:unnamed protein product [Paramecium pentaurelia]